MLVVVAHRASWQMAFLSPEGVWGSVSLLESFSLWLWEVLGKSQHNLTQSESFSESLVKAMGLGRCCLKDLAARRLWEEMTRAYIYIYLIGFYISALNPGQCSAKAWEVTSLLRR